VRHGGLYQPDLRRHRRHLLLRHQVGFDLRDRGHRLLLALLLHVISG
jgi:hypothetical protein